MSRQRNVLQRHGNVSHRHRNVPDTGIYDDTDTGMCDIDTDTGMCHTDTPAIQAITARVLSNPECFYPTKKNTENWLRVNGKYIICSGPLFGEMSRLITEGFCLIISAPKIVQNVVAKGTKCTRYSTRRYHVVQEVSCLVKPEGFCLSISSLK